MSNQPVRMSVQITDKTLDQKFIVPVCAASPEEASRRALANYMGESQGASSIHAKLVQEGKLSAHVVEIGGDAGDDVGVTHGAFNSLNWLIATVMWFIIIFGGYYAFMYGADAWEWLSGAL